MEWVIALLAALGWLLLGLLALLLLILSLPLHVEARGAVDSEEDEEDEEEEDRRLPLAARGVVRVAWAWGLVAVGLRTGGGGGELRLCGRRVATLTGGEEDEAEKARKKQQKRDKEARKRREKKKKKKAKAKGRYGPGWFLRHRGTMERLLGRLWRALRIRLAVAGALGLGDPADTVVLAEVLRQVHCRLPGATLDIDMDYLDEILVLDGALTGRLWLPPLVGIALTELPRRDVRRMLAGR